MSNDLFDEKFEYLALYKRAYSEYDSYDEGHSTSYMKTYEGFNTEKEMLEWVKNREVRHGYGYGPKDYVIIKCSKVDVELEVKISVKGYNT